MRMDCRVKSLGRLLGRVWFVEGFIEGRVDGRWVERVDWASSSTLLPWSLE